MARPAIVHLHADLTAWILDVDLAQRSLHEHHKHQGAQEHHDNPKRRRGGQCARLALLEEICKRCGDLRDDADKDDQRDAVTDAAGSDLLTQPHQEHGATDQRDDAGRAEEPTRIGHQAARFQRNCNPVGLERGQQNRQVPRILIELLAPLLTLFLQLLELRHHGRHELHDDRRRNIGHDAEGKDAHPAERTAREHVQNAAKARRGLVKEALKLHTVDPGDRDVCANPVNDQKAKREQDPLAQLGRLTECTPAHVCGHLLCG